MPGMTDVSLEKPLLAALAGRGSNKAGRVPFWFMRQAGRYLPEYRELRAKAGGFLNMVYDPAMAKEVTMQPLRRFGMDAAILFSDILVVPHALGRDVRFEEGEGPKLTPVKPDTIPFFNEAFFDRTAAPVYEAVAEIAYALPAEGFGRAALIGFAGAPWTVACYMAEGGGSRDFLAAKRWAAQDPESFGALIDSVTAATVHYLEKQVAAGAEALQIFDSWAGVLDENMFRRWVITPAREIAQRLKYSCPGVPLIGFPRGAGILYRDYAQAAGVSALGLDWQVPPKWAAGALQSLLPVQGNLDPALLLTGGDALTLAAENILGNLSGGPFVFNLGHGIIKETPPENVETLCALLRDWRQ